MPEEISIYQKLKNAGIPIESHESDLYCPVTADSTAIVKTYKYYKNVKTFMNQVDHTQWYEIPFAYLPYWEKYLITLKKEAEEI
jgi:hypothetical protein